MQPTPVFVLGESHRQRSLVGYGPWGFQESDKTEQLTLSLSHAAHPQFHIYLLACVSVTSVMSNSFSCTTLSTPWTVAHQAPLSMGFPRQGYWSGLPLPSPLLKLCICITESLCCTPETNPTLFINHTTI